MSLGKYLIQEVSELIYIFKPTIQSFDLMLRQWCVWPSFLTFVVTLLKLYEIEIELYVFFYYMFSFPVSVNKILHVI